MVGDRISTLPDTILCHILSFLPTKAAVATSVLSKRWNPLWRSVSALDFEDYVRGYDNNKETYSRFVQSVYAFILSRDMVQPIQRFRLCCYSSLCDPNIVKIWVNDALQRRVEHIDLSLHSSMALPSTLLSCKTLVVLKLNDSSVIPFSSVDLPSLKVLHLDEVEFLKHSHLVELLYGTPNLEDLAVRCLYFQIYDNEGKFRRLHKLVRAGIGTHDVPLEIVSNVEFLHIDLMTIEEDEVTVPEFHNLTNIKFDNLEYTKDWLEVLKVLKHCPKLQILAFEKSFEFYFEDGEGADWPYPESVPTCISLHLKTCGLNNYEGLKGEIWFARYIMQNARHLQTMTIRSKNNANQGEKLEMIKDLSLCTRCSETCKLSFE